MAGNSDLDQLDLEEVDCVDGILKNKSTGLMTILGMFLKALSP